MSARKSWRLNSWQILILSVLCVGGGCLYGWSQFREKRISVLERNMQSAQQRLAALQELDESDVVSLTNQTQKALAHELAVLARLKASGLDDLLVGQASVLKAQKAVTEALVKRKIHVVTTSAAARLETVAKPVEEKKPAKAPARALTADEYEREAQRLAAGLDPKMRADFMKTTKAKVARMRAAEAQSAAAEVARRTKAVAPVAVPRSAAPAPFKTENLTYEAEGHFKDIFMFFVDESFKKPSYNFADIVVTRSEADSALMHLSFTLQVNYK